MVAQLMCNVRPGLFEYGASERNHLFRPVLRSHSELHYHRHMPMVQN